MSSEKVVYPPEFLAADRGPVLIGISILFLVIDTAIVALRFWSVRLIRKSATSVTLDDAVLLGAWLFNIGLCIVGFLVVQHGGSGRRAAWVLQTDPSKMIWWYKLVLATEWLCSPAIALPKISVLLLYLRIFTDKASRIISHALIYILIAYVVAYSIATGLQCIPLSYQWDPTIPGGRCFNVGLFWKSLSFPNIITDVIILVLPLPMIFKLQLSNGQKVGILAVFLSASIGLIASCIRMASFFSVRLLADPTWDSVELIGWSIAEPGLYLFAACAVQLRPLFSKFARNVGLKTQYGSGSRKAQSGGGSRVGNIRLGSMPSKHGMDNDASSTTNVIVTRDIAVTYEDGDSDRDSSNEWTTHHSHHVK
ncbi:integral membrane protein [Byssothecium circinans]|uniref:Integral membrane protein n=1 Tax=Byssothecium circinans TaxID=147558 RepID=A0A6A5TUJ4_9PLEO|nr:integral membrane protein [Byssothecium circinans]